MLNEQFKSKTKDDINTAYKNVFSSPDGQVVLAHLGMLGGLDQSNFSSDPIKMAMKEGQRRMVLEIIKRINAPVISVLDDMTEILNTMIEEENNESIS